MKNALIEGMSWVGVGCILLAYVGVTLGFMDVHHWVYPILNMLGAVAIAVDAFHQRDYQPAVLNVVWFIVAVIALVSIIFSAT